MRTERYVLRLFVAGMTARSARAVRNIRSICNEQLAGRFDLEVIDLYQQPVMARDEQVIAAPTLVRKLPLPVRRVIGDLSERDLVLQGLGIGRA